MFGSNLEFRHPADIEKTVLEVGMLPFFENGIAGFSVAEHTPSELWFSDEQDGPWEWKGPIIQLGHTAYGKFFNRKAGWVALEWLPDLVNVRRASYPLPPEDSQAPERLIYEVLRLDRDVLSRDLKREVGLYGMKLKSTFERYIAQLQMGLWACISDFEYNIDQHGNRYGWGLARYSTPEVMYGADFVRSAIGVRTPEESLQRLVAQFNKFLPDASDRLVLKLLK